MVHNFSAMHLNSLTANKLSRRPVNRALFYNVPGTRNLFKVPSTCRIKFHTSFIQVLQASICGKWIFGLAMHLNTFRSVKLRARVNKHVSIPPGSIRESRTNTLQPEFIFLPMQEANKSPRYLCPKTILSLSSHLAPH